MKKMFLICLLGVLLFLLLSSVFEMPSAGGVQNPSYNQVAKHYIENTIEDTNVTNVVAAIITDYRAFDTLGETTVLFTSIAAVISVLSGAHSRDEKKKVERENG